MGEEEIEKFIEELIAVALTMNVSELSSYLFNCEMDYQIEDLGGSSETGIEIKLKAMQAIKEMIEIRLLENIPDVEYIKAGH